MTISPLGSTVIRDGDVVKNTRRPSVNDKAIATAAAPQPATKAPTTTKMNPPPFEFVYECAKDIYAALDGDRRGDDKDNFLVSPSPSYSSSSSSSSSSSEEESCYTPEDVSSNALPATTLRDLIRLRADYEADAILNGDVSYDDDDESVVQEEEQENKEKTPASSSSTSAGGASSSSSSIDDLTSLVEIDIELIEEIHSYERQQKKRRRILQHEHQSSPTFNERRSKIMIDQSSPKSVVQQANE